MLITDKFVYIHQPKTGGTFVTSVLKKLYGCKSLDDKPTGLLRRMFGTRFCPVIEINKHGRCAQIPRRYRGKPIVASIRNPYDRYVSQYEFKWWHAHPESIAAEKEIKQMFPSYPDLTFEEFVLLRNTFFVVGKKEGFAEGRHPGWHSEQFIKFFFRDYERVLSGMNQQYFDSGAFRRDMFPVRFLNTSSLNRDLHEFLREMGHTEEEVSFILSSGKIYPREGGRDKGKAWEKYYSPELKDLVRKREWLLFDLFPEFDV